MSLLARLGGRNRVLAIPLPKQMAEGIRAARGNWGVRLRGGGIARINRPGTERDWGTLRGGGVARNSLQG